MKITLVKKFDFEAAQSLPNFPGDHKCQKLHGHSFIVEISVTGEVDPKTHLLYDHAKISQAMQPLLERLDHAYLNDIPGLENPTLEIIVKWFWDKLQPQLPGLSEIKLQETPRAWCIYRGE